MECLNVSAFRIGFSANLARFLLPFLVYYCHSFNKSKTETHIATYRRGRIWSWNCLSGSKEANIRVARMIYWSYDEIWYPLGWGCVSQSNFMDRNLLVLTAWKRIRSMLADGKCMLDRESIERVDNFDCYTIEKALQRRRLKSSSTAAARRMRSAQHSGRLWEIIFALTWFGL